MNAARIAAAAPTALHVILAALATVLVVIAALSAGEVWITLYHTAPHVLALPFVLVYIAVALGVGGQRGDLLLAVVLTGMYSTFTVFPFGDHMRWTVVAGTDDLFRSEILANLIYRFVYLGAGPDGLAWISPAVGLPTALAYFAVCRTYLGEDRDTERMTRLYYLACAVQLVFFWNYIECAQLAIPFLLGYLLLLHRYLSDPSLPRAVSAAVMLAAACLVHGQNLFVTPSLPMAILIAGIGRRPGSVRDAITSVVVLVTTIVAVWLALDLLGYNHVGGHERVPFPPTETFGVDRFGWFSLIHWKELANIVLLASPVTFAAPFLAVVFLRAPRPAADRRWVLTLLGLGSFAFVFIWSFDFGFPMDFDLMLSMSTQWGLALLAWLLALARTPRGRTVAWVLLAIGAATSWLVMWSFADRYDPRGEDPSAPRIELKVNGTSGRGSDGPVHLEIASGDKLRVEVTGIPGATFFLLAGPRQPGNFVSATVGTLDLGTPPNFADVNVVHSGKIGDDGRFSVELPARARPGPLVNVQALFPQEPGGRYLSRLSASFYVDVRP